VDRRAFLAGTGAVLLAAPLAAEAQPAGKVWRIVSFTDVMPSNAIGEGPFYDRLRELGWVHGRNFVLERRAYGDQIERIPDLAAESMRSGVDIFMVSGSIVARRLQQVTRTIPIVAGSAGDLVEGGLAASLARPGGNVTGVQTLLPEMAGKTLALLKEAIPGLSRSGVLIGELGVSEAELRSITFGPMIREAETTGKVLGIRLQIEGVHRAAEFAAAFSAFRDGGAKGILVLRSPFTFTYRKTIADLALKHRIPVVSDIPGFARDGGLMAYGFDLREASRLAAETIDQILRGTQVSEVPIRQVTTFHLSINLKTAKALGLTIPPSLLQRADELIQ
jgi:putative ABC transport system substrate-binding protein